VRRSAITCGVLMALLVAPSAAAGPFEDAVAAHKGRDYDTALRLLRPLASRGMAEAQYNLGIMYDEGQGVPQDYTAAVMWYRLAADQGFASAQYAVGVMYYKGEGVPQDYAAAMRWYRLAADQGNAYAQFDLGAMYVNGQGVPQDYVRAHMWFNLSAAQDVRGRPLPSSSRPVRRRGVQRTYDPPPWVPAGSPRAPAPVTMK
jgi:hypothetical protein